MRRDFLKLCGLAGLGYAAPIGLTSTGRAQVKEPDPYEGPYFLVFNASGGWDTTYLMDPKGTDGINRLYREGDILTNGPHRYAPTSGKFEPGAGRLSNEDFYAAYGDDLLVLNGLDYSVNNHSPCQRYTATGKLDSHAYPTFSALAAACRGSACPLAFLTFGNYSATGNLVPMSRVPYLPTLKLLAKTNHLNGGNLSYHDDFVSKRIDETLEAQFDSRLASRDMRDALLPGTEQAESMLYSAQFSAKALGRVVPFIRDTVPAERLHRQAEIALASFRAGLCVSANLSIGQFDSHANNDRDQMKLIPEFLGGIDYALKRAEELGIRDKLVVIVQSEMGRTPNYNKGDGKDHWSIGSIMFLGAGIRGNRVVGATDGGQFLIPVDPKTLRLSDAADADKGLRVRPEHVHEALREFAGIERHPFSEKFPLKVDEAERLESFWG